MRSMSSPHGTLLVSGAKQNPYRGSPFLIFGPYVSVWEISDRDIGLALQHKSPFTKANYATMTDARKALAKQIRDRGCDITTRIRDVSATLNETRFGYGPRDVIAIGGISSESLSEKTFRRDANVSEETDDENIEKNLVGSALVLRDRLERVTGQPVPLVSFDYKTGKATQVPIPQHVQTWVDEQRAKAPYTECKSIEFMHLRRNLITLALFAYTVSVLWDAIEREKAQAVSNENKVAKHEATVGEWGVWACKTGAALYVTGAAMCLSVDGQIRLRTGLIFSSAVMAKYWVSENPRS
jgi:hypothetical protein